jgi:DNA-binding NarL/FixJ family response regulator
MERARVLVADDHAPSVALWRSLLQPEFEVIATVETGDELVAAAAKLSPDVIVTDIAMAGLDGIGAAEQILRNDPAARIVFVTVLADPAMVRRGLRAGALGYVLKMSAGEDLVPAVHAALRGERHVSAMPEERRAWNAR